MARDLTTATKNESVAAVRAPVWFAFFDFKSGAVRVWTGVGSVSWDSQTWLGLGELASVEGLTESVDTGSGGPVFTLTKADASLLALALADNYNGRTVQVWRGFRNLATGAIVVDPAQVFRGQMGNILSDIMADGNAIVRVFAEPRVYAPNVADDRRMNDADQQIDFPGDTFFALLPAQGQKPLLWPGPEGVVTPGGGSGAGGSGGLEY